MEKEDINEILEMIGMAKGFTPVVDEAMVVLKEYVPYLKTIYERLLDYGIEKKDYSIKKYIELDYTREEAILLVLDTNLSTKAAMDKWERNIKKSINK